MNYLPKIAVIIYCHNKKEEIEKTFKSVLDQNYSNKEIIIIDDASEDSSWENICKMIGQTQDVNNFSSDSIIDGVPISAIRHEFETGIAGVILAGANKVWKYIDIIGLLRGGDEYLPGKLSQSVEYVIDIIDKVGIVYSDYEIMINNIPTVIHRESFTRDKLGFGNSVLITKKSIESVGMVNLNEGDNTLYDLWVRITERFVAIHIPEILTKESV